MLNWQIQKFGLPTLPFQYETMLSLRQGKKDTSEQFALAQTINLEEKIGAFAFQFHENAIVFGFLCENGFNDDLGDPEALRRIGNLFI